MLQVNYWVDFPSFSSSGDAWSTAWKQAKSEAVQQNIPGLGNDSFYKSGRLTFEKGDLYVTIEAIETDIDLKTQAGMDRQNAIEKQVALDMLNRMR